MEQFATEEQQVEAIKRFWKENGMAIILGAVIGFGGLWGWRYYSDSQLTAKEAASLEYQSVIESLQSDDPTTKAEAFIESYGDSGYATITSLIMASQAVDSGDLAAAEKYLSTAASTNEPALQSIALLRLARVQVAQGNAQQALDSVAKINDEAFSAQIEEVKGDAYVALADFTKARLAYSAAVEADANNRLVKMKLDNLAVASTQATATASDS